MHLRDALRGVCASSIAAGAAMHAAGLVPAGKTSFESPGWMTWIFWTAIVGYSAFHNEIRSIGFITLVVEPLAVLSGILLLWDPQDR